MTNHPNRRRKTRVELKVRIELRTMSWSTIEEDPLDGSTVATVREDRFIPNKFSISCDQYYSKDGEFDLTITQPLERAMRTFMAALVADEREEEKERLTQRM